MFEFLGNLLDTDGFMERWHCGTWTDEHGYLHIVSDLAIFAAYFAIPIVLAIFVVNRKDIPFPRIFWLFAMFILSCGLGHLIEATLFWHPWYRLSGLMKLITALVSWASVIGLAIVFPKVLTFPSLAKKVEERTAQLASANIELEKVNGFFVDRELKMIELKRQVNQLSRELGKPEPYDLWFAPQSAS